MKAPLTVIQLLPALQSGGVERSTLETGRALVAAGHRSIVISAGGRLLDTLQAEGSQHITLDIGRKSLLSLRHVGALRQAFLQLRPDIVHARSRLPAWLTRLALHGERPPPHFITTVHGLNSPGRYSAVMTRGERVICVSETVRAYVLQHYPATDPARLRVIPRGIDPHQFPRGHRPSLEWRQQFFAAHPQVDGGRILTLPGRGTRLKGHTAALDLLRSLRQQHIDARLLLLGAREAGRERYVAELESHARALGVADAVAITTQRSDVREVYAISDLILQLSTKPESFGRTVIEALSIGRPVLGFDHGGVGELLRQHYPQGAVPLNDIETAAARAVELLDAPPPVPPLQDCDLATQQSRTLAVYREVCGG
jgi:glycosyltransferase involved in cell wall biosynthesis